MALARRDGIPAASIAVSALPDWLVDEPGAPVRAAAEVALRRALLPGHPLAFVEPRLPERQTATWRALVAALLPDAGDVEVALVQGGDSPEAVVAMRAAAAVATELRDARVAPVLTATAVEHAEAAASVAAATLAALSDQGWRAIVDQPLGMGTAGFGAEAVAERTETFDPLAVEISSPA